MAKSSFNNVRIQLKNDTSENWKNSTLVLLAGEFAVENDTGLFKIGNGTDVFSALPYANDAAQVVKEFNELKDKIGTIPDDKTIIQLIEEAATSGGPVAWDDIENKPTKVSAFENDVNYLTEQSLSDYATKTDLDVKQDKLATGYGIQIDENNTISWDGGKELTARVDQHEADITTLKESQLTINTLKHRAALRKVEIGNVPAGTLVNYGQDEVRVMAPSDTVWTANRENKYYMSAKLFAPSNAKYFRESLAKDITDETYYEFENYEFSGIDEHGCKYSLVWLPMAEQSDEIWTYTGSLSAIDKGFLGWYWHANWYDENKNLIGSDIIRINLSNENCHNFEQPYYMIKYAQKADLPTKTSQLTNDSGFLTEHQSLENYTTKDYVSNALASYAKTEDIPDVSGFITEIPDEYVTDSELDAKGYMTEQSVADKYMTKAEAKNPLKITGATAGQIVKIKTIDADGNPTEWEAIDIPSDSGLSAVTSVNGKTGAVTIAASDLITSSSDANKVAIAEDGTLEVNSLTFDRILQSEDDEIILSGGGA